MTTQPATILMGAPGDLVRQYWGPWSGWLRVERAFLRNEFLFPGNVLAAGVREERGPDGWFVLSGRGLESVLVPLRIGGRRVGTQTRAAFTWTPMLIARRRMMEGEAVRLWGLLDRHGVQQHRVLHFPASALYPYAVRYGIARPAVQSAMHALGQMPPGWKGEAAARFHLEAAQAGAG